MKRFSKLIGIILSLVLVVNICCGMSSIEVNAAESTVATVWVVACTDGNGHAFIVVKNTSTKSITVGKYSLGAGRVMTTGTFGNLEDGKCLYYNVEKYRMVNGFCAYTPNVALSENVTSSQLSTLSSTIVSNTKWTLTSNCSTFATKCWNSFSSRKLSAGAINTPSGLTSSIKKNSGYASDFSISGSCSTDDVKYQSSQTASLKTCSLKTVSVLKGSSSSSSSN